MGIQDLWLFVFAAIILAITPGPDMALILARTGRYGLKGGVAVSLGVAAGSCVHILAAAVGISAMLFASATAFTIVKWAGALYLVYMGVMMLVARPKPETTETMAAHEPPELGPLQIAAQGALTNILNPKVAVFFLALLPQFVSPDAPSKFEAFLALGLLLNAIGTAWNLLLAWFAAHVITGGLGTRTKLWLERTMGAFFIAIGARLAVFERG